mmetsp:Transcript_87176/g.241747  ORF Transcript_87176/g.241747 Transcript_87176/m.241747 type:complete len:282 (-) Transcript_87176:940-1785(-)
MKFLAGIWDRSLSRDSELAAMYLDAEALPTSSTTSMKLRCSFAFWRLLLSATENAAMICLLRNLLCSEELFWLSTQREGFLVTSLGPASGPIGVDWSRRTLISLLPSDSMLTWSIFAAAVVSTGTSSILGVLASNMLLLKCGRFYLRVSSLGRGRPLWRWRVEHFVSSIVCSYSRQISERTLSRSLQHSRSRALKRLMSRASLKWRSYSRHRFPSGSPHFVPGSPKKLCLSSLVTLTSQHKDSCGGNCQACLLIVSPSLLRQCILTAIHVQSPPSIRSPTK